MCRAIWWALNIVPLRKLVFTTSILAIYALSRDMWQRILRDWLEVTEGLKR